MYELQPQLLNPSREQPRDASFYPMMSGSARTKIEFEIVSVTTAASSSPYNGLKVATATVDVAPCGMSSLLTTSVEVVDHSGCLFNEDNADLVGRTGWAFWGVAVSLESGAPSGELTPCHWVADNICCP